MSEKYRKLIENKSKTSEKLARMRLNYNKSTGVTSVYVTIT